MKKFYFLFLLCCVSFAAFAQTTVTIYATGVAGSNTTGSSTLAAYTDGNINAGTAGANKGFAVFNLGSIPPGVIIGSVTVGYTVANYTCLGAGLCNTYGISGNVYSISAGVAGTLFTDLTAPAIASLISSQSYGGSIGNHSISTNAVAQNLVQDNEGGVISISFTNAGADNYTITGETGGAALGGAPYLTITYCTAPSTAIVYASEPPGGPNTTGYCTTTTFTPGNIISGAGGANRGYAVFNLSGIPAGSFIGSVTTGFNVATYTAGTSVNTIYGYPGDISTLSGTPATLYAAMVAPSSTALSTASWGAAVAPVTVNSNLATQNFIQANLGGTVSLSFVNTGTGNYTITGETGTATTTGAHAPYLLISYFAPPTAVTAAAGPSPLCYGSPLGLTGTATGANMYAWTGPGSFSSNAQNPIFTSSLASAGAYTLIASNGCGNDSSAAAAVTTTAVSVISGPITGITNVWVGFTTQLSDLAAGGSWASSNAAIATVDGTGMVTGVSPGVVNITYTTASCTFTAAVTVVTSVFSQIPVVAGATGGGLFPIVAWYPFCADTLDHVTYIGSGPNLNNGDPNTAPATLTPDRFGIPNNAYRFNGVNSMMWLPTFFSTMGGVAGSTGDYTYSVWMEADTIQNSIIEYNGNANADGFGFVMNDGQPWVGPAGACNVYNTAPGNKVCILMGGVGQFLPTTISLHQWHNLVLKKNGNSYDFYIDDVSAGFFITNFNAAMSTVFALGVDYASTTTGGAVQKAFNGSIDDVIIYNRQLSDPERDSLYNFNPDARVFTLGNDTTICSDSITLIARPPTIGNYYLWGSPSIDTISTDSTVTLNPAAGALGNEYWLQVGKPYGCFAYDTIRVYKAPIPINIGPDSVSICLGDSITLTDITPHSSLSSFFWNTGATSSSIEVSNPGLYILTVDSVHYFTALDSSGVMFNDSTTCVGRDTVHLHVYPVPIIGLPAEYSSCSGVADTLIAHFDSAYQYLWNNLTNTSDTMIDSAIGTHIVWVKVTDTGCFRIDTVSVQIIFDTLTFLARDTAICLGQFWPPIPTDLLVTDNHIASYQWTPTSGIPVSNIPNPTITPDTSAEYILTVSYPRCPDIVDSFYLDVQPNPIIFPGNNRSVCQFDSIHISSGVTPDWYQHYIYTWSPSNALDASTTNTVVFSPIDTTSHINLIVTVSTPVGCSAKDSVQLFVHPGNFLHDTNYTYLYNVCPGDSVQLIPVDSIPGSTVSSYYWSPGMYLSDSTVAEPWVHPVTSLSYRLIGTSQYGCRDTINYGIYVEAAAVIYLGDSVNIYPGEPYLISPQTNCVTFLWYPPLQIDDIHSSTPTVTPIVNTTYIVYASTEAGCTITDSIRIRLTPKPLINIPNAFTPGSGINGTFLLIPSGAVSLVYFRIFNRWGNKVFETQNITEGWDGTFNGKPQPFDVYVYEIEAKGEDGEVFQRVGNVTLLR